MIKKPIGYMLTLLLIVTLSLLGCTSAPSSSDPATSGDQKKETNELRVALSVSPPSLDLVKTSTTVALQVGWHIFEPLVTLDKDYKPIPMLAKAFEVSKDGKEITFTLRVGITFHNGKALGVEDVIASLNRWKELSPNGKTALANATISSKDNDKIMITLEKPSGTLLTSLAFPQQGAMIMPKEVIEAATEEGIKEYIGTGPFKFVEWKQDQYIHLEKYANYQALSDPASGLGGKKEAMVDRIYFHTVPDAATRVAGLQSGEYDFADELPFDNYEQLKGDPNLVTVVSKPQKYVGMIFNKKKGLFANVTARQAVNAALDHEMIMMGISGNPDFFRLDHSLMFVEQPWHSEAGKEKYNQKNPELAKKLLAEAGYNGEPVTIITTKDYEYIYKSSIMVKDQLEKIGVKVNFEIYDWPTMVSKRSDETKWNIFFTGFPTYTNPVQTLYLDSRNKWPGWYDNPEMDALLDELRHTVTFDEQKVVFEKIQALFWEDLPIVKIGDLHGLAAHRNYVKGYQYFMDAPFWNVSVQ
ncbi:ABC transporter substrate-binding protein [Brevibacillus sp. BC25]|uniref:ABC transporter substrate-binding protein n=1 Tax=Brevibacillus sp. BC25 TaxID=1144308 RepID=UPI0002711233|nr:ABC transporter substrate-binding protein [Brevibacillus sp. BC25]EJL32695.1 ABC-type dipeptide transport system, periplasmic component [Brevibacillus sp. BC25]